MKIAIFDPSDSFRRLFKASINEYSQGIEWYEFSSIQEDDRHSLDRDYDAIVTAKELGDGEFSTLIKKIRISNYNEETPIFLFTSESSGDFLDEAFELGVTDIYTKQELITAAETFHRMICFINSVVGAELLIIEDDTAVSQYYAKAFTDIGLKAHQANNYKEAIAAIDAHPIELIITDLNLDDGSHGQRVIRDIRHNRDVDEQGLPIMVMSSSAAPQNKTCLFYLGIDEYIVKPVLPRELCLRGIHLIQKFRAEKAALSQASRFKEIAHYDSLTGAYSRHGFLDVGHFCVANCKQNSSILGLIYLDLDHFKPVNDKLGHATGDGVLTAVVTLLERLLNEQDIICRWGGDEFVVILQNCEPQYLSTIGQRIVEEFKRQKLKLCGVSCSIGLSHGSPKSISDLLEIIDQADQAMYFSKNSDENTVTEFSTIQHNKGSNAST